MSMYCKYNYKRIQKWFKTPFRY